MPLASRLRPRQLGSNRRPHLPPISPKVSAPLGSPKVVAKSLPMLMHIIEYAERR